MSKQVLTEEEVEELLGTNTKQITRIQMHKQSLVNEVSVLMYNEGYSIAEVAVICGITQKRLESMLHQPVKHSYSDVYKYLSRFLKRFKVSFSGSND